MKFVRHPSFASQQHRGFILITGLIFLVVLTMLALAMFRSVGLQERIAGNTRDKQRALEAAQSALQYGEWWLNKGLGTGYGLACNTKDVNGNDVTAMSICSNVLSNPSDLSSWPAWANYVPPNMTVASGGGLATNNDINYNGKPGLFINFLGFAPNGQSLLYQVNAFGFGGNPDTVSVVQSTYQMKSCGRDLTKIWSKEEQDSSSGTIDC